MIPTGAKKNAPAPNSQLSTFTSASLVLPVLVGGHAVAGPHPAGRRPRALGAQVRLAVEVVQDRLVGCRLVELGDGGVVQVERGTLGADPRDAREVVPRRRAGGGPLERSPVAPGVVHLDQRGRPPGLPHVVDERQRGGTEQEGTHRGELVLPREAL